MCWFWGILIGIPIGAALFIFVFSIIDAFSDNTPM